MPRKSMENALRQNPLIPRIPLTTCSVKSYANPPTRKRALSGALIPSKETSPFTGTLISARKPILVFTFVSFQSA